MNRDELRTVLEAVEVGRLIEIQSWEIQDVRGEVWDATGCEMRSIGWLVRPVFVRPDRDTQVREQGRGRWWHVELDATHEQVCRTAFSAVRMLAEHEMLEFFRVGGLRLFDPHEQRTAHGEPALEAASLDDPETFLRTGARLARDATAHAEPHSLLDVARRAGATDPTLSIERIAGGIRVSLVIGPDDDAFGIGRAMIAATWDGLVWCGPFWVDVERPYGLPLATFRYSRRSP